MDKEILLTILKSNIQRPSTANDQLLEWLLKQAKSELEIIGIKNDESDAYYSLLVDYSAFLFRKRADSNMQLSPFVKREINDLLFHQKSNDI